MKFVNQKEFAKKIGKTAQYVNKLVRLGKLTLDDERGLNLKKATAEWKAIKAAAVPRVKSGKKKAQKQAGRPARIRTNGHAGPKLPTITSYRTETEKWKGLQAKLDYDKASGNLLAREDVLRAEQRKNMNLRSRLMRQPRSLAMTLAHQDPATVERLLTDAHAELLRAWSVDIFGIPEELPPPVPVQAIAVEVTQ